MKYAKRLVCTLLGLAMALSLAACGTPAAQGTPSPSALPTASVPTGTLSGGEENSHYPVTITTYNYAGELVETVYEKAPERVVAVYQGCIETMIALGLEDHVIASYGLDNEVKDEWKDGFARMHYDESVFAPDKETVTLL